MPRASDAKTCIYWTRFGVLDQAYLVTPSLLEEMSNTINFISAAGYFGNSIAYVVYNATWM